MGEAGWHQITCSRCSPGSYSGCDGYSVSRPMIRCRRSWQGWPQVPSVGSLGSKGSSQARLLRFCIDVGQRRSQDGEGSLLRPRARFRTWRKHFHINLAADLSAHPSNPDASASLLAHLGRKRLDLFHWQHLGCNGSGRIDRRANDLRQAEKGVLVQEHHFEPPFAPGTVDMVSGPIEMETTTTRTHLVARLFGSSNHCKTRVYAARCLTYWVNTSEGGFPRVISFRWVRITRG